MKKITLIHAVGLVFLSTSLSVAQTWETVRLAESPSLIQPEVSFLSSAPLIDGILDSVLSQLPVRSFATVDKLKPDSLVSANYRIAYGAGFFYLYLEACADRLTFRDRAYQNGDGFVMLLALPQSGGDATGEFYELACSAVNKPALEWTRRIFWNQNVDKLFVQTSDDAKLEFHEGNGRISFELLLPWADVRPCHPWISEGIGFNLTFTKAVESQGKMIFGVVDDPGVGAEFQKRRYAMLKFQVPKTDGKPQTYVSLLNGHIAEGDSLHGIAVTASDAAHAENVMVRVVAGEGEAVSSRSIDYACTPGLTKMHFALGSSRFPEGGYSVRWESQNGISRGSFGLSVFQKFDSDALNERVARVRAKVSESTFSTSQFLIGELSARLAALRSYETAMPERLSIAGFMKSLSLAERGADPFAGRMGFIRKAYRSRVDSSLQPYVVFIPQTFERSRKYPLLVYLHGSATRETGIQGAQGLIPDGFIALGPLGRGPSNGFARDYAQEDIAEAIAAVERDYPIDTTRIVLIGFSMGGYGVYRTFYETPAKFRALAVFSGGPSLGKMYAPESNPPDFTDERNLRAFHGLPIFIFHGEKDLNVPIEATRDLLAKLQRTGAKLEVRIEPDKGHESPGKEVVEVFKKWIGRVVR